MLKSGDVSFDFGFEWCLGSATGYVAKISMLILATYPSANSPSWPPCPGMFGTWFGTFGTFGTSGTFGTFLDPGNTVRVQHGPEAQLLLAQHWPWTPSPQGSRTMLSMHGQSLSVVPEPMLSLSMLILATRLSHGYSQGCA